MWIATCKPEVSENCLRQCRRHQKSEVVLANQTNQNRVGKCGVTSPKPSSQNPFQLLLLSVYNSKGVPEPDSGLLPRKFVEYA